MPLNDDVIIIIIIITPDLSDHFAVMATIRIMMMQRLFLCWFVSRIL